MDLTILIISYKSLPKLDRCISHLGNSHKVIVIENSNNYTIKKNIEKKFSFCEVVTNDRNLGYGAAANIGYKKINTDFALLINTDTLINESEINEIKNEIIKNGDDFALASPIYDDLIDFSKNNEFDKNFIRTELNYKNTSNREKVEIIKGCSLIINCKKIPDDRLFDDNYFFFYEEIDLCKRIKDLNENIYVFNKIKIKHGNAEALDGNSKLKYDDFRNWNYYWSRFYYHKKHYGFLKSFILNFSKLIRFFFNTCFMYPFSKKKFRTNKYRFLGLISAILNIKSENSDKILN